MVNNDHAVQQTSLPKSCKLKLFSYKISFAVALGLLDAARNHFRLAGHVMSLNFEGDSKNEGLWVGT